MLYAFGSGFGNISLQNPFPGLTPGNPNDPKGFAVLLNNVVSMIVALASIALFVYLMAGGFQYITAGGDKVAVDNAKKTITHAITGIVIMSAAFVLVNILGAVLGRSSIFSIIF